MSISTNQPENFNYFSPVSFRFNIQKIPNVNFFCQAANLPGLTLGEAIQVNPLRDIPTPGDKVQFEELQLRFIVDEELENWLEMYNWIKGLGFPDSFDQSLTKSEQRFSDATLMILTSNKNGQHRVSFKDAFPLTLSGVQMDSSVGDIDYVTADPTFAYTKYTVEKLIGER